MYMVDSKRGNNDWSVTVYDRRRQGRLVAKMYARSGYSAIANRGIDHDRLLAAARILQLVAMSNEQVSLEELTARLEEALNEGVDHE